MLSSRSWMWSSLGLTLVLGVCLGVVVDRLVLPDDAVFADAAPAKERPVWFLCNERGSLDIEEEPGYPYPEGLRTRLLERLQERLGLRAEQVARLEDYLEESRHDAHEFWETSRHGYCDIRDAFRAEIRELLDPDQRERWDEMTRAIDHRENELIERLGRERASSREAD